MPRDSGFTLVELMIVVAIMAILSSVAIPAYMNHVNRGRQSQAIAALFEARVGQEMYYAAGTVNARYAATIGCLENFGGNCANTRFMTASNYRVRVISASANSYTLRAEKVIYSWAGPDIIIFDAASAKPRVLNTNALSFSIFDWLFK